MKTVTCPSAKFLQWPFLFIYLFVNLQDSAFEFEKKRNVPVKYNRELWSNTGL